MTRIFSFQEGQKEPKPMLDDCNRGIHITGFAFVFVMCQWLWGPSCLSGDEVGHCLAFPPLDANPARYIGGQVASDGETCVVIQGFYFNEDTHEQRPADIKIIALNTQEVLETRVMDGVGGPDRGRARNLVRWLSLTHDARHYFGRDNNDQLVFYRVKDGKLIAQVDLKQLPSDPPPEVGMYVPDDLRLFAMRGSHSSEFALVLGEIGPSPRVLASLAKGPFQNTSTFRMTGSGADARTAAVMIPKKHQTRSWKLLLLDMKYKRLAEMDVPAEAFVCDIRGGNYPMVLLAHAQRWTLLSLEHDKLTAIRFGTHNPHGDPKAKILSGAISPDGQWLVTSFGWGRPRLGIWSVVSGMLVREVVLEGASTFVRFDTQGRYLSCTVYPGPGQQRFFVWDFKALVADMATGTHGVQQPQDPRMGGFRNNGQMNQPGMFDRRNGGNQQ